MPLPVSPVTRIAKPFVFALKWILVLFAVFVYLVVVPIVELARELGGRLRRLFAARH